MNLQECFCQGARSNFQASSKSNLVDSFGAITRAVWPGFAVPPDCIEKACPDSHICCSIPGHSESRHSVSQVHRKSTRESQNIPDEESSNHIFGVFGQAWCVEYCTSQLYTYGHMLTGFLNKNKPGDRCYCLDVHFRTHSTATLPP